MSLWSSFKNPNSSEKNDTFEGQGKLTALDRVQAVIEFDLQGNILTANDNFLNAIGYSLDEIQGRHHRMFVEEAVANGPDYQQFWDKLRRGEFEAGEYKRIAKGGREIWIQASYNPILDESGRPVSIVKFATDITAQKLKASEASGQIDAINKSLARIEFELDGTIIDANDNFLGAIGYSLGEIRGQHHRMFVEESLANSAEYREFWENLRVGRFQAGEYKRLAKGGREIWIQASYNPIFDASNRPIKVVKFATDITAEKELQNNVQSVLADAARIMGAVAEGDLTQRMPSYGDKRFDELTNAINTSTSNLSNTVTDINRVAAGVDSGSSEISLGNTNLSERTESQASSLEETAASMEQITDAAKQNAESALEANNLAIDALKHAKKGGSVVKDAVVAMDEISEASTKISAIIGVIDEIAFQTNLLALNASVEAARAGEQGRGFAVVASEVRNLAGRSATAAKEIKNLIRDSGDKVEEGSRLVNQSGETLDDIVNGVKKVTDIVGDIATASDEQSGSIEQVNVAVRGMEQMTQQNAALVEEAAAAQ